MPQEEKPVTFVEYYEDKDNPRKQKAVVVSQEKWEENWLTWWYRRGSQRGERRR